VRRRRRGGGEKSGAMLGSPPKENDGGYFAPRALSAEKGEKALSSEPKSSGYTFVFSGSGLDSLMKATEICYVGSLPPKRYA
jgi:hypothetical protein